MSYVTSMRITDRDAAIAGVLDAWVRAARAFSTAGVYPVETGIPGVSLDRTDYSVLRELAQRGPRRLGDLALAVNLNVSHVSRLMVALVDSGLVERTVPAEDRRVTILGVTPAGGEAAAKIERQFLGLISDRLAGFEESEAMSFAVQFQRFADELVLWSAASEPGGR